MTSKRGVSADVQAGAVADLTSNERQMRAARNEIAQAEIALGRAQKQEAQVAAQVKEAEARLAAARAAHEKMIAAVAFGDEA